MQQLHFNRRRSNRTTSIYTQGDVQTQVISKPGGGVEYIIQPAEAPVMSIPGSLPGGGYMVSIPGQSYSAPQLAPQPAPTGSQIPVQQVHFASHPRPKFVTTVGDSADDQPLEVKTGDDISSVPYNPAWAPRPFVPPTRPSATCSNVGGTCPSPISVASRSPQQHPPRRTVQDRDTTLQQR